MFHFDLNNLVFLDVLKANVVFRKVNVRDAVVVLQVL